MSFDRPEGLWVLALAVPILAFHFYRGRIRRLPVPTLLLWEQVLVEEERKSALQRLRHYASLLLNLLALTVLTSAVSDPRVKGITPERRRIALVVDTSPSMLAREPDGRTRLDRARAEARAWIDAADEAVVYDGEGRREGPESLRVGTRGDAAEMARVLRRTRPDLEVVLLSGGAPVSNRGWISGACVQGAEERFPSLRLRARDARGRRVAVRWNGEPLAEETAESDEFVFPLDPARHPGRRLELGGVAEVAFAEADAFPLDDVAWFVVPPSAPPPIVVFHREAPDPLLLRALDALAARGWAGERVLVSIAKFAQARPALVEGTATIFDRCEPPEPVGGAVLRLGAAEGAEIQRPVVTDWDRTGPLLEGADLTSLAVLRARVLRGGVPLIETASGPIATVERRAGVAQVVLGFSLDLRESDLALRAAFPIFLRNWIDWVRRGATRSFPAQGAFGEPLAPETPWLRDGTYLVRTARGEGAHPVRSGPILPEAPGVCRISAGGREEYVAVNFFDPQVSAFSERSEAAPPPPPAKPWYRRIPYAVLAAAVVLGLLLFEWFLFHRGWI